MCGAAFARWAERMDGIGRGVCDWGAGDCPWRAWRIDSGVRLVEEGCSLGPQWQSMGFRALSCFA